MPAKNPRFALNFQDQEVRNRMEQLATENLRTLSAEIEMACRHWIKQHEEKA